MKIYVIKPRYPGLRKTSNTQEFNKVPESGLVKFQSSKNLTESGLDLENFKATGIW